MEDTIDENGAYQRGGTSLMFFPSHSLSKVTESGLRIAEIVTKLQCYRNRNAQFAENARHKASKATGHKSTPQS